MFIDTHCHLNFHAFDQDIDQVIKNARNNGVDSIVIPGAKIDSSQKAVEIASIYENCFAAVGVHPHHAEELKGQGIKVLKDIAENDKVIAIGEIGLDYHEENLTEKIKIIQKELLKMQLEIAIVLKLPVILHCREAFEDMLPIIANYKIKGVFHCFGGETEDLRKVLNMGYYVGFDGNITYKNAQNLRDLVLETPLDRILIETDSPYLSPEPYRGERNIPQHVKIVAETIAGIKNIKLEEIALYTTNNAKQLFNYSR